MSSRNENPVAFITGASRGIGKACAVYLAEAGYDVAISARTVNPGEEREHSSTVAASNTKPLPGSLSETASLIEKHGRQALIVPADLLDTKSLEAAANTVLDRWGRVDLLVHNGRYIGPGHMDRFLDTPLDLIEKQIYGNVIATLVLNRIILPVMIEQGGGSIVNMVSASGYASATVPAGDGGWGMGYGVSKGAMQRIAGFLHVEHRHQNVYTYNVQPGFIATERIAADMGEFGFDTSGAPPDVVAAVVKWLVTSDEAPQFSGETIEAQFFCHERGLLPSWPGPTPNKNVLNYDTAGADLQRMEEELLASSSG